PQSPARPPQTITTLPADTVRPLRSCCTFVSMPAGVTSRLYAIAPLAGFPSARWNRYVPAGFSTSASTYSQPPSITGVPVIPSGLISPQGKLLVRGAPKLTGPHCSDPSATLNAYRELFSVATMTLLPSMRGSAKIAPSSGAEFHALVRVRDE